jgi:hypothetical protein
LIIKIASKINLKQNIDIFVVIFIGMNLKCNKLNFL